MRPLSSVTPILLLSFGLVSVSTLRSIDPIYGINQLLFFLSAAVGYVSLSLVPSYWLTRFRWPIYLMVVLLLAVTLAIGRATNGSVSWIHLGNYRLQPSEFLKPALIFLLAIEGQRLNLNRWSQLLRFMAIFTIPMGLVMLQPDLGTTLVTGVGVVTVYLLSQPSRRQVMFLGVALIILATIAWSVLLKPYQKNRILTFLNPTSDPLGSGYNAQQALIAIGAGGVLGTGFGNGAQSHLRFLPERQTDFLFATYAEETGLAGTFILLCLYAGLFGWIIYLISRLNLPQEKAIGAGFLAMLMAQSYINIGMNLGIAPITGVTLPLFSLGGSSLLSTTAALGLLESLRRSNTSAAASIN